MKKTFLCILALLLACAVSACGQKDSGQNQQQQQQEEQQNTAEQTEQQAPAGLENSRTYAYFAALTKADYFLEIDCTMEGEGISYTMTQASQNGQLYLEFDLSGNKTATFTKDGYTYNVNHSQKSYSVTETPADNQVNANMLSEITDNLSAGFTTGEREVDGISYYTESYPVEGGTISCCFDGNDLVYLFQESADGSIRLKLSKQAAIPAGLFEVPDGYTRLETAN